MDLIEQNKEHFDKAIEYLKHEISSLRTGRATPALVEDIVVEAYGSRQPLKAVASISVADAKTINVDPWDKSVTQAVETAIRNSQLGISPVNDGKLIRLPLPELTHERRQELVKVLHQKLEAARVSIRKLREDVRKEIDNKEKAKEIGEDDKYGLQDELEKMVKEYNEKIKLVGEEKEKEITTV
ncbi:MAG TPA: ribosome recycling factor [Candidatus Magasanikbacteria bacterium]|nr:ribosome recycling factor [Candidatus Magasanikbacteria bacterium]